jgi:hypothetical protein
MRTRFSFDKKHRLTSIDAAALIPANVGHLPARPATSFAASFVERNIVRQ